MSHIHIPDGVIAPIWLLIGFLCSGLMITYSLYKLRQRDSKELVPKLGVVCALVLLAMSVPLGPFPVHLNLTVFMGIILGPWLGFIAAFIINLLLSLVGHGGLSVVGINTLLIGLEVMLGYMIFALIGKRLSLGRATAVTVLLTLIFSNTLLLGIVGISGLNPSQVIETAVSGDVFNQTTWQRIAIFILSITGLGILLETLAISTIIKFIYKIRPDIFSNYIRE